MQQEAVSMFSLGDPEIQEVLNCLCSWYIFPRLRKKTQYSVLWYFAFLNEELKVDVFPYPVRLEIIIYTVNLPLFEEDSSSTSVSWG